MHAYATSWIVAQAKDDLCKQLDLYSSPQGENPCTPLFKFSHFTTLGVVEPALRWWLRFFPIDRFLFINND